MSSLFSGRLPDQTASAPITVALTGLTDHVVEIFKEIQCLAIGGILLEFVVINIKQLGYNMKHFII